MTKYCRKMYLNFSYRLQWHCHSNYVTLGSILGRDVAQVVDHSAVKVWILLHGGSILHGGTICRLGYFPFQPVHTWSIKDCGMCCPVCGNMHLKDPLLLIRKSTLCGDSEFPLKKYVTMIKCLMSNSWWYENQWSLEASSNKTNFPFR